MRLPARVFVWAFVASAVLSCARFHELESGNYTLIVDEVLLDECGIAGTPDLFSGALRIAGDRMQLYSDFFTLSLVGYYLAGSESFSLDGTAAGVATTVGGQSCLVDLVSAHLEAETESPTLFHGTLDVRYQSPDFESCQCRSTMVVHGERR